MRSTPVFLQSQKGMVLIGVLVAAAVLAVVVASVLMISRSLQLQNARAVFRSKVDDIILHFQNALTEPGLCDNALRTGSTPGGNKIAWPNPAVPVGVGHIEFNGQVAVGVTATTQSYTITTGGGVFTGFTIISTGQTFEHFTINSITLRQPTAAEGGPQIGTTVAPGPVNYTTVKAKLEFQFSTPASGTVEALSGASFGKRSVDLVVAVNPVTKAIDFCYQPAMPQTINIDCSVPANLYPGSPACPAAPVGCQVFYYILGFDAFGKPMCQCQISCQTYLQGPPG